MARVLLIDDDPSLLDVLALALNDAGHAVETAPDGGAGLAMIRQAVPELVITDVKMPGIDGFALLRRLREVHRTLPIILLTSRDDDIDEALGLELGADDYVAKPFSTRVLLARVAALLRRETARSSEQRSVLRSGALAIDPDRLEVSYQGVRVEMTVTEFRMLEALVQRPGIVLTRSRLLDLVRGDETFVAERIVDTYVKRIRRKLESVDAGFDRIETVIGAGYRWRG